MTIEDLHRQLRGHYNPWSDVDSAILFLLTVDELAGQSVADIIEVVEAADMSEEAALAWIIRLNNRRNPLLHYSSFSKKVSVPFSIRSLLAKEFPSCL